MRDEHAVDPLAQVGRRAIDRQADAAPIARLIGSVNRRVVSEAISDACSSRWMLAVAASPAGRSQPSRRGSAYSADSGCQWLRCSVAQRVRELRHVAGGSVEHDRLAVPRRERERPAVALLMQIVEQRAARDAAAGRHRIRIEQLLQERIARNRVAQQRGAGGRLEFRCHELLHERVLLLDQPAGHARAKPECLY